KLKQLCYILDCSRMALPPYPFIHLRGEKRGIAFFSSVSACRLHMVFRVGSPSVLNAIERIIYKARVVLGLIWKSLEYLFLACSFSTLIKALLCPFLPRHCCGLEDALDHVCLAMAYFSIDSSTSSQWVDRGVCLELERWNKLLLQFVFFVHSICRSKGIGPSRIPPLTLTELAEPIGPPCSDSNLLSVGRFLLFLSSEDR
ncbi:hypothetical protein KI387_032591, partial [Taxus chinensis]